MSSFKHALILQIIVLRFTLYVTNKSKLHKHTHNTVKVFVYISAQNNRIDSYENQSTLGLFNNATQINLFTRTPPPPFIQMID